MKNTILILSLLISTVVLGHRNDSIINKYFLSNKVKDILIKDSNRMIKKIQYSRKGHITTINYYTSKDTTFQATLYPSGNARSTGICVNNKREGEFRYFADKQDMMIALIQISNFKNDKLNGQTIILKQEYAFQYDTLFIWNHKDGKQTGPTIVYYGDLILLTYYYHKKEIITMSYYRKEALTNYKVKTRRLKKYDLDINLIMGEFKRYFPGAPFIVH